MIGKATLRIFIMALLLLSVAGFGGAWGLVREGNKLFAEGQFDQALTRYTDAQLEEPDNPSLQYNIGTVLYKQKKYKEAVESFQKVAATANESDLKEKALYNMGNAYFRQAESAGDIELLSKAVDAYTEALKLDPNDTDAKYNLEVVRRMLELKKQENPPQKQCQNPQNNQNQKQDQNRQNAQNKQNKPEENKPATAEASVNPQENKQATSEMQNAPAQGKMTREEAEQLLKALEEKERENTREQQQARISGRRPFAGKDW